MCISKVLLVDVDSQNDGAGGNLRRSVVKELRVIQLELANLEAHVPDVFFLVEAKESEVSLH